METQEYKSLGKCCPVFDPIKWDNKIHEWNKKPFVKESIPTIFHIPIPGKIDKKIKKMVSATEQKGLMPDNKEDWIMLFCDPTAFRSNIYMPVKGKVADLNNLEITGMFISKVYEGEYREVSKNMKKLEKEINTEGKKLDRLFIHYAYCPKCAKDAGTNYMVFFVEYQD